MKYHPFLIKPNKHELENLFDIKIDDQHQIIECAQKLQEKGARNVLVTMDKDGAILLNEDGQAYHMKSAEGTLVNSVGAGDSMIAGFLAGWIKTQDYQQALLLGTACGGATAFSDGLAKKEAILLLLKQLNSSECSSGGLVE